MKAELDAVKTEGWAWLLIEAGLLAVAAAVAFQGK